jgi:hypothetical protein
MIDSTPAPTTTTVNYPPNIENATPQQVKQWVDAGLYYGHDLRCRDASEWRRAELYDQGAQWLREAMAGYEGGTSAAQWVEMYWSDEDPRYIPTPVFNEGVGARINESARMGRPNYRPKVSPKAEVPDLKSREGAKSMKEMLTHRLHETHWDDKHSPLLYYHMPLYGGAWWKSEFVLRWDRTVPVPVLGSVRCPQCGTMLASPQVPADKVSELTEAAPEGGLPMLAENTLEPGEDGSVTVQACPWCPDHPPMVETSATLEEAQNGATDAIGRPLGQEQPLGDWEMTVRSPYDMFARNMGLDMSPGEVSEWTVAHVEHLDWVGLRWPNLVGKVKPENPAALARYHPIAGAPDLLNSLLDSKMFENCVRVKERHKAPWMEPQLDPATGKYQMKLNRGRSAVVIGSEVMLYDHLLMPSINYPGEYVERVDVDYVPWEFIDGGRRLQGQGLWSMMFDPQDARNEITSQTQAVRKRLAVPLYLALTTHNFSIQGMRGIPGMLAEIEPDPVAPMILPQLINNSTIDAGVREELRDSIDSIGRFAGFVEVEKGTPPPGVSAGYAIEALKGAAGERREPRLARVKASLKRAWSHGARVMVHMYAEGRPMKYEDDDGEERWKYAKGLDFNKQTDVDVDGEPDFDTAAAEVEKVRDAITMRVIDPSRATPAKQRRLAKLLKLPEELFEDEDLQEKAAQREWIEFKDNSVYPRVDPGMDDNSTHYQIHGRHWHSAFCREQRRLAGWDQILQVLGGTWTQDLTMLSMTPSPQDIQDRVLSFWLQKLQMAPMLGLSYRPPDPQTQPREAAAFKYVMIWRAHIEAHRLEDEVKQRQAMMMPVLAAPGAPQTSAGNMPTEGAPPTAQPALGAPH